MLPDNRIRIYVSALAPFYLQFSNTHSHSLHTHLRKLIRRTYIVVRSLMYLAENYKQKYPHSSSNVVCLVNIDSKSIWNNFRTCTDKQSFYVISLISFFVM